MTEENEIIDSPGFIRQRRNIILASLVLAFALGTHLSFPMASEFRSPAACAWLARLSDSFNFTSRVVMAIPHDYSESMTDE